MTRILFTGINARYVHSNPAILYLKKAVSDLPFDTAVAEFTINISPEKITRHIKDERPDVIALSVYIWNAATVKALLPELKKNLPEVRIVCGGPEVSYNSAEWIERHPEIDFIITGGGEAGFRELALSGFNLNERVINRANYPFREIAFPYDDAEMKRLAGRFIYYESSRGCPFRCSYCLSSRSDQRLDFRDIEQVKSELDFFKQHGPRLVKFVDRTFNSRKEHYRAVWEYIVNKFAGAGTRFHFEIFPDILDRDDLAFLSTVPRGLFQFEMGIQSIKSETLAAINRGGRREGWIDNVRAIAKAGNIHLHVDLIAGLPFESYTDLMKSFDTVHSIGAHHFQCGFLKVLPGTEMSERSGEFGLEYSSLPPYQVKKSRWLSYDELKRLEGMEDLLEVYYNSGRFRETERYLAEITGSPFEFYERLFALYRDNNTLNLREWDGAAALLLRYSEEIGIIRKEILADFLRWDWCSSMKLHHYPDMLKSDDTVEVKRRAYNHIIKYSEKGIISFKGIELKSDELRRAIFFRGESCEFRERMNVPGYAMFLPDKRIVLFDIEQHNIP